MRLIIFHWKFLIIIVIGWTKPMLYFFIILLIFAKSNLIIMKMGIITILISNFYLCFFLIDQIFMCHVNIWYYILFKLFRINAQRCKFDWNCRIFTATDSVIIDIKLTHFSITTNLFDIHSWQQNIITPFFLSIFVWKIIIREIIYFVPLANAIILCRIHT